MVHLTFNLTPVLKRERTVRSPLDRWTGVMTERGILIAGGYGVVGRRIAADLAPDYQVVLAGRHIEHAKAAAAAIGHGVRGRELDVTVEASILAALQDVATVISCIDQPRRRLLHATIERGLRYTDITPHLMELGRRAAYAEIGAAARASGARVVLGTGIVPGISNVMVRAVADSLGGADVIETSLLLSASDTTGPASFDYFLQELSMPFEVHVNGADRPAQAFSDPSVIEFPSPFGPRSAYLFPFSDQVLYPRTMGAQTAVTRLAIEPARLGRLLAASVRIGAVRLVARERVRNVLAKRRSDRAANEGAARFALRVDVIHDGRSANATLVGGPQADAAAAGASATVRSLVEGQVSEPGAWMPEQVINPPGFFFQLAKHGLTVKLRMS
jgi:saccharopine dehydrogenase-like NADP-dependent oxidoreductase